MNEVVFVSAVRTAVGDFLGSLKDLSSVETGALVLRTAMERVGLDPEARGRGGLRQPGHGRGKIEPRRQVAVHAGCSWETVACTVNQQCVSSLWASEIMYQEILLGQVEVGAAVGARVCRISLTTSWAPGRVSGWATKARRRHVQRRDDRRLLQHPHGRYRGEHRRHVQAYPGRNRTSSP